MLPLLLQYVQAQGHKVFTSGVLNLNIVGIRSRSRVPNAFDDRLCVVYRDENGWIARWWPITTDPGSYYLLSADKQLNPLGTAALVPDQYRGVYQIDLHGRTKYEALCQRRGPVKVYRDGNHDSVLDLDPSTVEEGYFGINIHAASMSPYKGSTERGAVDAWSAGCQVFQRDEDFRQFMRLVKASRGLYGDAFTYTLVDEPEWG